MEADKKDGVSSLRRAGNNRFKDAKCLLEKEGDKNLIGACYLAGYTVECWLKVAILKSHHLLHIDEFSDKMYGENKPTLKTHNLQFLLDRYHECSRTTIGWYEKYRKSGGVIKDWSEKWRYENINVNVDRNYANNFINQVEEFMRIIGSEV